MLEDDVELSADELRGLELTREQLEQLEERGADPDPERERPTRAGQPRDEQGKFKGKS